MVFRLAIVTFWLFGWSICPQQLSAFTESACDSLPLFPDTTVVKQDSLQEIVISDSVSFLYAKPKPFQCFTRIPKDILDFGKVSFAKKNLWVTGSLIAATAVMIVYDQEILDETKSFCTRNGLPGTNVQHKIINWSVKLGNSSLQMPVLIPGNLNTSMYFLGDGMPHFATVLGFWLNGKITKDNRSLQTASQLLESMVAAGIVTQTLKHITGRESPFVSSAPGGIWRVFPNQVEYAKHVPNHDAFPSGHLATLMSTVTVIAENYPNNKFVKPVGYTLVGALTLAMVNNGVHWLSDDPLGIAIGYAMAKIVTAKGHAVIDKKGDVQRTSFFQKIKPDLIMPSLYGGTGLTAHWSF